MSIARRVCEPSGTLPMVNRPSAFVMARSCVPTTRIWALASGRLPCASVTVPLTVAKTGRSAVVGTVPEELGSAFAGLPPSVSAAAAQSSVSLVIISGAD